MIIATWTPDGKVGPFALKASGALTASANGTAYEVGKGKFRIVTAVTAIVVTANTEHYTVVIEANSRAASTVWNEIGVAFSGGAKEVTGRSADDAADEYEIIVDNPYDYQIRVTHYIVGSSDVSITDSVKAYPLDIKA